jgi:hypothetical protein
MKPRFIIAQTVFLLPYDLSQFGLDNRIGANHAVVENDYSFLCKRADGKLTMKGMSDFSNDQDVEGQMQDSRDLCGNNHSSSWQAKDEVQLPTLLEEAPAESPSRIFSRCKHLSIDRIDFSKNQ